MNQLKEMCPIPRHRKFKGSTDVVITDISKWEEILEVLYIVRCNLFHGRKSLQNAPDRELVNISYEILKNVFESVIRQFAS